MTWTRAKMTLERILQPRDCPRCGRHMDAEFLHERRAKRLEKTRERNELGKANGRFLGRKRRIDWTKIEELRRSGLSYRSVAFAMSCSTASVKYICKKQDVPTPEVYAASKTKPAYRTFDTTGHRPWLKYQKEE